MNEILAFPTQFQIPLTRTTRNTTFAGSGVVEQGLGLLFSGQMFYLEPVDAFTVNRTALYFVFFYTVDLLISSVFTVMEWRRGCSCSF